MNNGLPFRKALCFTEKGCQNFHFAADTGISDLCFRRPDTLGVTLAFEMSPGVRHPVVLVGKSGVASNLVAIRPRV